LVAAGFILRFTRNLKIAPTIFFVTLSLCHFVTSLSARGLDINVDVIKLRSITPGIIYDVGKKIAQRIVIRNRDTKARRYTITFHKPSELGVKWNKKRYREIPDVRWLWAETKDQDQKTKTGKIPLHPPLIKREKRGLEIPANAEKEISVYLKVPDKKKYYGRRFCAVMAVTEVADVAGGLYPLNRIILAVYPRIEIEVMGNKD